MFVPSATVFLRRALSYLMTGQSELALRDAMQAQVCMPEWPTAFYLQAVALSKLGWRQMHRTCSMTEPHLRLRNAIGTFKILFCFSMGATTLKPILD